MDLYKSLVVINKERHWTHFTYPKVITESEAQTLQKEIGYHPAGYGFYSFTTTETHSTWKCQDHCD